MEATPNTVLFGVTVGTTANTLMRGQLGWLAAQGWTVHLACAPGPGLDAAAAREGCQKHPIPMDREIHALRDARALVAWIALIRRVRPAVTHLSTPKAALVGSIAAWLLRVPRRVYLVRGLRLEGASGLERLLLWLTERLTIALSTDVLVVGPSLGRKLAHTRLLGRQRAALIGHGSSNGVDVAAISARANAAGRDQMRNRLGVKEGEVVVGYVGRIVEDKGIGTLLAAVELTKSKPTLLLVGPIDDPSLGRDIAAAPVRVIHVGWTDDVWAHYAAMDILCLPTRREGFPNVVLEAAAVAIPCISTDATGAVDAVVPGVTGETVHVGDSLALAAAIDRLAGDAPERARLGAAAHARAVSDFRPEDIWTGVDAILHGDSDPRISYITQ